MGGEKEMATGPTASIGFTEVAGVAVGCKNHVDSMIVEYSFLLSGQVIEELSCV